MLLIAFVGGALTFTIIVMVAAAYLAKDKGKSPLKWSLLSLLGLFVLTAWDYYPTQWAHQYYCEKESGFWIYKTLDQWKAENPGVMETLVANKGAPSRGETFDDGHGTTATYLLNDRINWIVTQQDISSLLPIIRTEQQVKDVQKNEVLARFVDFGAGNSVKNDEGPQGALKFWLRNSHCIDGGVNQDDLRSFRNNFMGAKK